MSINGNGTEEAFSSDIGLLKSPARLLAHLEKKEANKPLAHQLLEAAQWILCSPEAIGFCRLTTLCYDIPTKLQDGPQCGLVALWMASTSLIRSIAHSINQKQEYCNTKENSLDDKSSFIGTFPSVDWIQNTAIINLFSKRGEMFSADNLCALAEISFQQFFHHSMVPNTFKAHVLKKNVYSFLTSYDKMVEFFTDIRYHQVLLVPYDSDHDQRPCRKKGHKAHWCVISGLATFLPTSQISHAQSLETLNSTSWKKINDIDESKSRLNNNDYPAIIDDTSKVIVINKSNILSQSYSSINDILKNEILNKKENMKTSQLEEETCFYLIAKQSKSKRTFLFDPFQLANSNQNLAEVAPDQYMVQNVTSQNESFEKYVIPSGGISQGLANQVIVLQIEV